MNYVNEKHFMICKITIALVLAMIAFHVFTKWPYLEVKQSIIMLSDYEDMSWGDEANFQFCDRENRIVIQVKAFNLYTAEETTAARERIPCYTKTTIRHWENLLK